VRRSKPDVVEDPSACKRKALDLLARREHSRLELERKLAARGYSEDLIAPTLDDLEASGTLATARFTESFIRARVAKGQGPARIRMDLAQRGVTEAEAAALLKESGIDWAAAARAVRSKRFGASPPADFAERAQQARFLQYRGFDSAAVRAAVNVDDAD
jgi:regulatory protein